MTTNQKKTTPKKTDYDSIRPPYRTITLGEREINISVIPSEVILRLDEMLQNSRVGVSEQIELCVIILKVDAPDIDRKWFLANTNSVNIIEVIRDILSPIQEYTNIPLPKTMQSE